MNPTPTLDASAAVFVEALAIQRYSPASIANYQGSLNVFFAYLRSLNLDDVREVSRQTIAAYQQWLTGRDYSDWTRVTRLQAVRRFFEYLEKTDTILINPCHGMLLPKVQKRLPRNVLTIQEARTLLDAPDTQTKIGLRDKAMLEVFYSTGIRLEEMARLTIYDVDHRNGFVRVTKGKGGKDRVVPLGQKASDYVREYLEKVRAEWSKANRDERALWLSIKTPHGPIKSQVIEVMVRNYGQTAGLARRVTPHVFRHSCATHLVANGANIAYVQRLLGHRSLRTTQIYTRTTIAEIAATQAKTHPRLRQRQRKP